jgi:acylphosphatase
MAEKVRARVVVRGSVQGVFFRAETRDMAKRLGLEGWVINRPDGAVEAVFEGDEASVRKALDWSNAGPPAARVEAVDVSWEDPAGEKGFKVRYR